MGDVYLSTAYLGNVQYFTKLLTADRVYVEQHESYLKQSYRNRCVIMVANGLLPLVIPVEKESGTKMPIRDVRIDYSQPWQRAHWKSMRAAYSSSPFYAYYADDLLPFYERKERFLFDFNLQLTELLLHLLGIRRELLLTERYEPAGTLAGQDYRLSISPKERLAQPDDTFNPQPYYQVFAERWGFSPNLSVLDLLFNEGTNAATILKASIGE